MKVISRFDVLSVMKLAAVIYGVIGLVLGVFFAIFAALGFFAAQNQANDPFSGTVGVIFGVAAAVIFPVLYAIFGAVGAAIMAALYNVTSKRLGGIRVDMEEAPNEPAPTMPAAN